MQIFIIEKSSIYIGITNTVTALKNAQMAESPVLLLGGAAPSLAKGRGALQVKNFHNKNFRIFNEQIPNFFQDIDQQTLLRPLCKFCARITAVRDIVPTIQ